jgi:hypothetical protein
LEEFRGPSEVGFFMPVVEITERKKDDLRLKLTQNMGPAGIEPVTYRSQVLFLFGSFLNI